MSDFNDHLERDRVRRHTSARAAEAIDEKTRSNVRYFAVQPRHRVEERITELEGERDIEQVLEINASIIALAGAVLGTTAHKGFFLLTGVVLGFLTQHAASGWCPPVPVFRKLGVRTRGEIDQEKYALKALRGNFAGLKSNGERPSADRVVDAVMS